MRSTPIHIVVLGSSTAAGSGPSSPDSAWVNRYRKYLQAINPNNQVTNLAIGGTTTYHIMPTWYVAPSGRPATNPNNNVSRAISLNADAIIVNMPSNDASNGFDVNEQMHNFIAIDNSADSAGIPVWVCTTQPRNGFNATKKAIQTGVRDSVLSYFGLYAIDFWTGFNDVNNNINPIFDSGDGVHMNDTAHGVLEDRVIAENIPSFLIDTLNYTDHVFQSFKVLNSSPCGDSNTVIRATISNIGLGMAELISVNFKTKDLQFNTTTDSVINLQSSINACSADTVELILNGYTGVNLELSAYIITQDSIKSNDSSNVLQFSTIGHPEVHGVNDTICLGERAELKTNFIAPQDSVLWYDSLVGGNLLGIGNSFFTDSLYNDTTFYATAVRGGLKNQNSLFTSNTTTTNWNGIMFDIYANDTLTLDSLSCKMFTTGSQTVVGYWKKGSYMGSENTAAAWTSWGNINITVNLAGDFAVLNFPDLTLNAKDTIGVYLHLQTSGSSLSYLSSSQPINYANNEIQILGGSGIAHTFGTIYNPRNFSGELFYHHGFNENGLCSTQRLPVSAIVSKPTIELGNDTTINWKDSLILSGGNGFATYIWNDGSTGQNLVVDSSKYELGANLIWLDISDKHSCIASDTIRVTLSPISGIEGSQGKEISIYPNPVLDVLTIDLLDELRDVKIEISNSTGQTVITEFYSVVNHPVHFNLLALPTGIYYLTVSSEIVRHHKKILKY